MNTIENQSLSLKWDPLLCGKSYMRENFVGRTASTNGRMPVHAKALGCTLRNIGLKCRSTLTVSTVSWPRAALRLLLPRCCTHVACTTQARALSFLFQSPPTRMHAGCCRLCRCVSSASLPTQAILMPVCWLWLFHTLLWNERRRRRSPSP